MAIVGMLLHVAGRVKAVTLCRCSRRFVWRMSAESLTRDQDREYQKAVATLNGLQTPAATLQLKRERKKQLTNPELLEQCRLDQNHHQEPRWKLLHMQEFLNRCGIELSDLDRLNAIHVTGTKGKGSVCALCESILRKHNLKTGFFSSPHLLEVRERIRLNGQPLSKEKFVAYFWQCYNRLEQTKDKEMPTYFKFLTLMSFHVFLKEKVDVAIVEVGIGGAFDCTNIIPKPVTCAITALGYDHMDLLGETLEKIAWQKGGICKMGSPSFVSPQFPGPMEVLAERAATLGSSALYVAPPFGEYTVKGPPLRLSLAGDHQRTNASLAIQVCRSWLQSMGKWTQEPLNDRGGEKLLHGVPIAHPFNLTEEFRQGLEQCLWPGRSQIMKKGRITFYLDGAHTPQSMKACAEWFKSEADKETENFSGSVVRLLLFNTTKNRDPRLLMQALLDCDFIYAAFSPNIATHNGSNLADQTNMTVTVDSQLSRTKHNHQAWLEVTKCLEASEDIESVQKRQRQGLVTSSPDPLTLCYCGKTTPNFQADNARVFTCISDMIKWCNPGTNDAEDETSDTILAPPTSSPNKLEDADLIQVLVTGSLHLVGATMNALGCKLEHLN